MNEALTEQEFDEIRQIFASIDEDNDGLVRVHDLPIIFDEMRPNFSKFVIEPEELKRFLELSDIDESDRITFCQLLTLISYKVNAYPNAEELLAAFNIFDPNGNGFITAKDLFRAMQKMGENISEVEAHDMIRQYDRDLDGKISFIEFIDIIQRK